MKNESCVRCLVLRSGVEGPSRRRLGCELAGAQGRATQREHRLISTVALGGGSSAARYRSVRGNRSGPSEIDRRNRDGFGASPFARNSSPERKVREMRGEGIVSNGTCGSLRQMTLQIKDQGGTGLARALSLYAPKRTFVKSASEPHSSRMALLKPFIY